MKNKGGANTSDFIRRLVHEENSANPDLKLKYNTVRTWWRRWNKERDIAEGKASSKEMMKAHHKRIGRSRLTERESSILKKFDLNNSYSCNFPKQTLNTIFSF